MKDIISEAKELTIWGSYEWSWDWAFEKIPEEILQKLRAEDIAALVNAFMSCYADGVIRR